jgi:hypothetical protein
LSGLVRITGTTTITAFDTVAAGIVRRIRFAGALTLTYNVTSLQLQTADDIVTVAGDTCVAVSLGSGNWKVYDYSRADGSPLVLAVSGAAPGVLSLRDAGDDHNFTVTPQDQSANLNLIPPAAAFTGLLKGTASGTDMTLSQAVDGVDYNTGTGTTDVLAADQTVNNSDTLVDTALQVAVLANTNYRFEAILCVVQNASAGDAKFTVTCPASPTAIRFALFSSITTGSSAASASGTSVTSSTSIGRTMRARIS